MRVGGVAAGPGGLVIGIYSLAETPGSRDSSGSGCMGGGRSTPGTDACTGIWGKSTCSHCSSGRSTGFGYKTPWVLAQATGMREPFGGCQAPNQRSQRGWGWNGTAGPSGCHLGTPGTLVWTSPSP